MSRRDARTELRERARQLRREQTAAELDLWEQLRNRKLGGYKFRRQVPIGLFIADFCCVAQHLVIEVDGAIHARVDQMIYDQERTDVIAALGYRVLRIHNEQVERDLCAVLQAILHNLKQR
jgi:very-short-patch-repair endonuclease